MSVFIALKSAFVVYGLAIVISFLVAGLIKVMSLMINWYSQAAVKQEPADEADEVEAPSEVVATITAAVTDTLGPNAEIRRIKLARRQQNWTIEGRTQIMQSHRPSASKPSRSHNRFIKDIK